MSTAARLCIILVGLGFIAAFPTYYGNVSSATRPQYDVSYYGAKCDNSTDDTAAINATIAAIPANGPATLFFPGLCKVVSAITITGKTNLTIKSGGGNGADGGTALGASGLTCPATGNCLNIWGSTVRIDGLTIIRPSNTTAGCSISFDGASHSHTANLVTVNGFNNVCLGSHAGSFGTQGDLNFDEISGNTVTGGKALSFNGNTNGVVLREAHFGGAGDTGSYFVWLDPTQSMDTLDFHSGGSYGYGTDFYVHPNAAVGQIDLFFRNFICDGTAATGIVFGGSGQAGISVSGPSFLGGQGGNTSPGVELGGGNAYSGEISQTLVVSFGHDGVLVDSPSPGQFFLINDSINGNSLASANTYSAVHFVSGAGNLRIYDSNLNGNGSQAYAVVLDGSNSALEIKRNEMAGTSGSVSYGTSLSNITITDNSGYTAPAAYNPNVQANVANIFTKTQIFNGESGLPNLDAEGGNAITAPNLLMSGANNPGMRITDTFGGGGSDWSLGGGQSNSWGTGNLILFDNVSNRQDLKWDTSGNQTLLVAGAAYIAPAGAAASCVGGFKFGNGVMVISGAGAPTCTAPVASEYLRSDGSVGSDLYISAGGGTWNAAAGV